MMNESEITTEVGQIYFRFWRAGLRALLSWSDERISQWAIRWKKRLNNENDILFHWTASRELAEALIDDNFGRDGKLERKIVPSGQYVDLRNDLEDALNLADDFPEGNPDCDWQSARERVQRVLQRYGGSLP
jgi:hypothetical protein